MIRFRFKIIILFFLFIPLALAARNIKIKIYEGTEAAIESTGRIQIVSSTGRRYFTGTIYHPVNVSELSGYVYIKDFSIKTKEIYIKKITNGALVKINNKRYRGNIEIIARDGKLIVIEKTDIESYIKGIIKLEINPEWPIETVKAQAICARTFAFKNRGTHSAEGFDFCSTPHCQSYGGYEAESKLGNIAVETTRGLVIYYGEYPAEAFYCSNNGGVTAKITEVWEGEDVPYLITKPDEFSLNEKYAYFENSISFDDINRIFKTESKDWNMFPESLSPSGRILKLRLEDDKGNKYFLSKNDIRNKFGYDKLKSTLFTFEKKKDSFYIIGRGWGHGVGLSQWGARKMGEQGYTYRQILNFYFPGTIIRRLY